MTLVRKPNSGHLLNSLPKGCGTTRSRIRRSLLLLVILFAIINEYIAYQNMGYYLNVLTGIYDNEDDESGFLTTRFTPHVTEVVKLYEFDGIDKCGNEFYLTVNENNTLPIVGCNLNPRGGGVNPVSRWWCKILKQTFAPEKARVLPYNVSFGISTMDFLDQVDMYSCVGNSAFKGNFSLPNFQEVARQLDREEFHGLPWEQRNKIPIWRGTPWINEALLDYENESTVYEQVMTLSPRLKAIDWSLQNPSLLDARAHQPTEEMEMNPIWFENSTTGLHKLLAKPNYIPEEIYYANNQVALVLCGLGASFRTSIHLSTSTAVSLQECEFHEWFTSLMKPYEHYIPLTQDLSDLEERMRWIQENPNKVKAIAEKGRLFYLRYLSWERNEEHIYEFAYRLSVARAQYEESLTPEKRRKFQARRRWEPPAMEVVSMTEDRIGNVEEMETMCQELLSRAGDAGEGEEPWREGGLTWIMNDCADQAESVLGNHLSRWYMIRAVASSAGVSLEMPCRSPVLDRIATKVSPNDTVLDGRYKFSWKKFCRRCESNGEGGCQYPHAVRANGLERIRSVISTDLRTMAYKVVSEKPGLAKELDDVTIHLRCGDIGRQDHTLYGLVPFVGKSSTAGTYEYVKFDYSQHQPSPRIQSVYKKLIPKNATSIGIVTAPFHQDREGWGPGDPELNEAVATAARDYLQEAFPNVTVSIRNREEETLDMVYARLIMTNTTICGPSTFCVFPAIASLGESHIIRSPLFGDHPTWLSKIDRAVPHIHYVNKRYHPSVDLYQLNTTDIVNKLSGRSRAYT